MLTPRQRTCSWSRRPRRHIRPKWLPRGGPPLVLALPVVIARAVNKGVHQVGGKPIEGTMETLLACISPVRVREADQWSDLRDDQPEALSVSCLEGSLSWLRS